MFNIQGSELIFLLLIALVVLGPEKLPDAIRKFGRAYAEFKKMANGFQGELRSALDEPMRELRETADMMKQATTFEDDAPGTAGPDAASDDAAAADGPGEAPPGRTPPVRRQQGLNFGAANPRRQARRNDADGGNDEPGEPPASGSTAGSGDGDGDGSDLEDAG